MQVFVLFSIYSEPDSERRGVGITAAKNGRHVPQRQSARTTTASAEAAPTQPTTASPPPLQVARLPQQRRPARTRRRSSSGFRVRATTVSPCPRRRRVDRSCRGAGADLVFARCFPSARRQWAAASTGSSDRLLCTTPTMFRPYSSEPWPFFSSSSRLSSRDEGLAPPMAEAQNRGAFPPMTTSRLDDRPHLVQS